VPARWCGQPAGWQGRGEKDKPVLHVSLTRFGAVRGTNRKLVEAAAEMLEILDGLESMTLTFPEQRKDDIAA
jgi:hypothetical protein